jgi:hypothetical protein
MHSSSFVLLPFLLPSHCPLNSTLKMKGNNRSSLLAWNANKRGKHKCVVGLGRETTNKTAPATKAPHDKMKPSTFLGKEKHKNSMTLPWQVTPMKQKRHRQQKVPAAGMAMKDKRLQESALKAQQQWHNTIK